MCCFEKELLLCCFLLTFRYDRRLKPSSVKFLTYSLTHTHTHTPHLTSLSYFSKIFNHENYFYHYHQATTYHHHHQLWCTVVVEMNQRYQFVDFSAKDVLKGVVGTKFVNTCIKSMHFTEQLGQTIVCFNIKVKLHCIAVHFG